jgi:hypothetical protein
VLRFSIFRRDRWQLNSLRNFPSLLKNYCIGLGTSYLIILNLKILGFNTSISMSDSRTSLFYFCHSIFCTEKPASYFLFPFIFLFGLRGGLSASAPLPPLLFLKYGICPRISVDGQPPQWSEAPPEATPREEDSETSDIYRTFAWKRVMLYSNRAQEKGNILYRVRAVLTPVFWNKCKPS